MYVQGRQSPRRAAVPRSSETDLGRRHRPDYWLVALCALLLGIGVVVVYAISPALTEASHVNGNYYVEKQLIAVVLSIIAFLVTANVPLMRLRQWYKPLLGLAAVVTAIALILPVNPQYPAHRWVRLGGLSFQSVELLKFSIMIWMAGFLAFRMQAGLIADFKQTLRPLLIALGVIGAIVAGVQSDLGSTGVIIAMVGTMAFIAGLPMKRVVMVAGIIGIGLVLAIASTPYRRDRLATYLHPEADCQDAGYQACQALIAVGSGGLIGLGLGSSVQAYGYLPEAANDSIFAIYAEKFGFIGSIVLMGLFVALFARLKSITERAPDDFSRLVVAGVLSWLSVQALINIGAMIGLLPLKGITLPLISYGGTSVVFVAAAIGLAFQVSRYTSYKVRTPDVRSMYDDRRDGRRLRGAYHPGFSGRG